MSFNIYIYIFFERLIPGAVVKAQDCLYVAPLWANHAVLATGSPEARRREKKIFSGQ